MALRDILLFITGVEVGMAVLSFVVGKPKAALWFSLASLFMGFVFLIEIG